MKESIVLRLNKIKVPMAQGLGVGTLVKEVGEEIRKDHVGAFAGNLSYRGLFAIFPFLVFTVSILAIFNMGDTLMSMLDQVRYALPQEGYELLRQQIEDLNNSSDRGFTVSAILSLIVALWAISGAFRSIMESLNVMYDIPESRPTIRKLLMSVFLSLLVIILLISALGVIVFGGDIGSFLANTIGIDEAFAFTWSVLQWPLMACTVLLSFALIYYYAPNAKQRWRWVSPGSMVAFGCWLLFSFAFSFYVNNFGSYNATYGTLAGIVVLLLYMYYSSFLLLVGAEINQVIDRHTLSRK